MDPFTNKPRQQRPAIGLASATLLHQCDEMRQCLADLDAKHVHALARAEELRDQAREHVVISRNAALRARSVRQHLADMQATLSDWLAHELPPRSHARHTSNINEQDHAK